MKQKAISILIITLMALLTVLMSLGCNIVWTTRSHPEYVGPDMCHCYTAKQIDSICWVAIRKHDADMEGVDRPYIWIGDPGFYIPMPGEMITDTLGPNIIKLKNN